MAVPERTPAPRATPITLGSVLEDGVFMGVIGASVVAVWFLILDALHGRPLYTPALLGTLVMHGPASMAQMTQIQPSPVAVYTGIHFFAFVLVGIVASYLWELFERYPETGFVLVFAFVLFETGFFVINLALGGRILGLLGAWAVGVGNLLAALGMAVYAWLRHPNAAKRMRTLWEEE
jgi:hypothetical protein